MSDRVHPSSAAPAQLRLQHSRPHARPDEPGLCALEDYTCLTGESFAMRSLRAQLRRAAPHFRIALIIGETGTAKETVALALHRLTAESDATFIPHSALSLLAALQEVAARPTVLNFPEPAAGRARHTLFLADVGDLTHAEQSELLQSLKRIAALRIGPERPRLIFATGRDLRGLSGAGHFDRNLYRTISAVEILLPPLRSRPEDIPLITCGLLSRSARSGGLSTGAFDGRALSRLQCHDWPGNVRELERVVELARQHAGDAVDGVIEAMHLPQLGEFTRTVPHTRIEARVDRLDDVIQNHVLDVLLRCSGNKVRAAERLGISRSTLYRMLDASSPASALDRIA
jgi:DNA-binding NtrC family response regulator